MNIVVAGGGVIGLRIAEQVMSEHNVVYIGATESDQSRLERLEITAISGSLTSRSTLEAARVNEADVFIATAPDDEKNIVACVMARRLGAGRVICFLNRRGFFTVAADETSLADTLGIDAVVRPASQLAEEIIRIVSVPGALDVRSFVGGKIELQKFELDASSPLVGKPLSQLNLPLGALAVMGQRAEEFFIPRGDTVFEPGDRVTVLGTPKGLRRSYRYLADRISKRRKGRVVIVGGGLVGGAVAEGLDDEGWLVKVVEADGQRCLDLASQLDCLVLEGDGSDLDFLEQELADQPDVLVAVTSNDEKNLLISLLAQHLGVPRVITRADRLINERIFEKVGVDVVLSAKGAAIRRVINDYIVSDESHLAELEHGDFSVLKLTLPSTFQPVSLSKLDLPRFSIVGAVLRGTGVKVPHGSDTLQAGDQLLMICDQRQEDELHRRLLGQTQPPAP